MNPPPHKLTDVEGALLDELATLARRDGTDVAVKDLELRLEARGFTDAQTRRALMSLLRCGEVALSGAKRVSRCRTDGAARLTPRPDTPDAAAGRPRRSCRRGRS